jgi:hypothetical protein
MTYGNAPLSVEGRKRLVQRCQSRPIAHVAAEMGISRGVRPPSGSIGCDGSGSWGWPTAARRRIVNPRSRRRR